MDQRVLAYALERLNKLELEHAFDASNLKSRPTKAQQQVFDDLGEVPHRYVVAGNQSGKSQVGARETSWVFTETHPTWKRPEAWGDEPLLLLVVGRLSKQVEDVLWRKIKSFLHEGEYKEHRTGGVLQAVSHKNGNKIVFASHHSENEAREKLQAYVAHYVWIDEMPGSARLIEELHLRVQARDGSFLATFTPKVVNAGVRKLVDSAEMPYAKKYTFKMFDNPVYTEEMKARKLASLSSFSESYRKTILEGAWASGDQAVYMYDDETMMEDMPEGYSRSWRHVEAVDPAMSGKFGYTLWAEHPVTGTWYIVKGFYLENILDPEEAVKRVMELSGGHNVMRRIADPHEVWYTSMATKFGLTYMTPWNKAQRKGELIKNLQTALSQGDIKLTPNGSDLAEELVSCQYSQTSENRIVNSSSFHLLDCAQYFVDCKPKKEVGQTHLTWDAELRHANRKRRETEAKAKKLQQKTKPGRVTRRGVWTTGKRIRRV